MKCEIEMGHFWNRKSLGLSVCIKRLPLLNQVMLCMCFLFAACNILLWRRVYISFSLVFPSSYVTLLLHSVQLESPSDSDDDGDLPERGLGVSSYPFDDFHPLSRYSRYGNNSLRSNHRGSGLGGSRRKSSKGKTGAAREVNTVLYA